MYDPEMSAMSDAMNEANRKKGRKRDGEERSDEWRVVSYSAMQHTGGA